MPKTSIYLDNDTYQRAVQMTRIEERSMSNFIAWLLNREWRRNFQATELKSLLPDSSLTITAESIPMEQP